MNAIAMDITTVAGTALGAYLWLILVLRISGKRSLSKLNAFDFAVTVAFGSALSAVIINRDVGLLRGAAALTMLAFLQWSLSKLSLHWAWLRRLIRSEPTLLLENGRIDERAMHEERVTEDELAEAVRNHGFANFDQLTAVVLETDGSFSVIGNSDGPPDLLTNVRRPGSGRREEPR